MRSNPLMHCEMQTLQFVYTAQIRQMCSVVLMVHNSFSHGYCFVSLLGQRAKRLCRALDSTPGCWLSRCLPQQRLVLRGGLLPAPTQHTPCSLMLVCTGFAAATSPAECIQSCLALSETAWSPVRTEVQPINPGRLGENRTGYRCSLSMISPFKH